MQFRNPEILFALFFLIIPIIVHLFQLQRFKKTAFTNVALLKNIKQQSRKSERLKKWLILATRLCAFTFLILAFAGPEFSNYSENRNQHLNILLDNSYSMQAKGARGELLKSTTMELAENLNSKNATFNLYTNDNSFENLNTESLKEALISVDYSPKLFDFDTGIIKLSLKNSDSIFSLDKNILITDLQNITKKNKPVFTNVNRAISLINLQPSNRQNHFIDSVYIKEESASSIQLNVLVKSSLESDKVLPVSLFEGDKLIGKASAYFSGSDNTEVPFTLPWKSSFLGKVSIDDGNLNFDNEFYFSINKSDKINVLSIGENAMFLGAIYTISEFNFLHSRLDKLDYNLIGNQDLIVLNSMDNIPSELIQELEGFYNNGGDLMIIPSETPLISSYNNLLSRLNSGVITHRIDSESKVNTIHYDHFLFSNVFEKRITNFDYPEVNSYLRTRLNGFSPILSFDSGHPFISSTTSDVGKIYFFSAPLDLNNSNFYNSPLVVPIIYNIGKLSLDIDKLYYTIAKNEQLLVKTQLKQDDVIVISDGINERIPEQILLKNKVQVQLGDQFNKQGFYTVSSKDGVISSIALNYDRVESLLQYSGTDVLNNETNNGIKLKSLDTFLTEFNDEHKMNTLFKWFLMLTVLFLLIEVLILKFVK